VANDEWQIFGDKHMTIEDLMRERGQLVKKGTLSEDGDLEFWEDGRSTKRNAKEGSSEPKGIE
jgi:protein import protein ZIM17